MTLINQQDTGDHDDICGGDGNDGITVADDDNHDVAKGNDGGDVILTDNEVEYVAHGTCSSQRPTTEQHRFIFPMDHWLRPSTGMAPAKYKRSFSFKPPSGSWGPYWTS